MAVILETLRLIRALYRREGAAMARAFDRKVETVLLSVALCRNEPWSSPGKVGCDLPPLTPLGQLLVEDLLATLIAIDRLFGDGSYLHDATDFLLRHLSDVLGGVPECECLLKAIGTAGRRPPDEPGPLN